MDEKDIKVGNGTLLKMNAETEDLKKRVAKLEAKGKKPTPVKVARKPKE